MKTLEQWLSAYGQSHQNKVNQRLHHVCVPAIVFSLLGLLWLLPLPGVILPANIPANVAMLLAVLVCAFYYYLSWRIATGASTMIGLMLLLVYMIDRSAWPLHMISLLVFVLAWVGQFIGHAIEGKRPSFAQDIRFLLIGPLWVIAHGYEVLGIPVDKRLING